MTTPEKEEVRRTVAQKEKIRYIEESAQKEEDDDDDDDDDTAAAATGKKKRKRTNCSNRRRKDGKTDRQTDRNVKGLLKIETSCGWGSKC